MEKRDNKEKISVRERLCHALDVQPDVFLFESLVEIRGRNCVAVSGSGRVLTYTDNVIRLTLAKGVLRIEGERLCCASYHYGATVVDGLISCVCFEVEE